MTSPQVQSPEMKLLESLVLTNAAQDRRGREAPLVLEVLRPLSTQDLELVGEARGSLGVKNKTLARLRHSHHLLARLLAEGHQNVEASRLTGYDEVRIAILLESPAFLNLIEYYKSQDSAKDLDFRKRLAAFGADALEEMHQRLDEDPSKISWKQLQEAAAWAFEAAGETSATPGKGGSAGGLNLQISFVTPNHAEAPHNGPSLEGTFEEIK